jgi:cell volume regulation protein A
MELNEPFATAVLLTTFAILLGVSALFGRAFERIGLPVVLGFLAMGVLAGMSDFAEVFTNDYETAFRIGTIALTLIIFEGGLNTSRRAFRSVAGPALVLATLGVALTAAFIAGIGIALGLSPNSAMLLGAAVASTDAAAVFSLFRDSKIQLNSRIATLLKVESAINDPAAVLLTLTITAQLVASQADPILVVVVQVLIQLVIGVVVGFAIARAALFAFTKIYPPSGGLMAVVTTSLALLSFGITTILGGSGFVAVFVAGITLGNGRLPMRHSVTRFHDAFGWLSQITMFLVLGLLAVPERIISQLPIGIGVALGMTLLARPLAVFLSLRRFDYSLREIFFVGWVGLRGAVPIVLGIFPVLAGYSDAETILDIIFVLVVFNAIIPGSTVRVATQYFRLEEETTPAPSAVMEIEAAQPLNADLVSFYVTNAVAALGVPLSELPFPEGAAVSMIVRGNDLIPPKGSTVIEAGDHVYVITRPEDLAEIQLLFGRPELG